MRARIAAVALALACLAPRAAHATPPEIQRAFTHARQLLRDGKVEEAAQEFLYVVEREPAVGALLNLGECYERLGKKALAYERFTQAATLATEQKDDRAAEAHARAAKLEPVLTHLVFAFGSGLADHRPPLVLDGETLPPSTDVRVVDAGKHTLEIRFEAPAAPETRTVDAAGGATQTVVIEKPATFPVKVATIAPARAPSSEGDRESARPSDAPSAGPSAAPPGTLQRRAGLGVAGAGVFGVVIGAVFGVVTSNKVSTLKSTCPEYPRCPAGSLAAAQSTYDSGHTSATISTIGFVAGGVLLAGGAVLYFTAPRGSATVGLRASPSASGGSVDFSARF